MKAIIFFVVLLLSFSLALALMPLPMPVLYGEADSGNIPADGAVVEVSLQQNSSYNATDIVGAAGNYGVSGYWKVELNDLNADLNDGDVLIVRLVDGDNQTTRLWEYSSSPRTVQLDLNLNLSMNDYDNDSITGDTDCNDNNADVYPGHAEVCGNGIDDDCDGSVDEDCGTTTTTTTTTSSGGGGGGGSCTPNWECTGWGACQADGTQTRTCSLVGSCQVDRNKPDEVQECDYTGSSSSDGSSTGVSSSTADVGTDVEQGTDGQQDSSDSGINPITGAAITDVPFFGNVWFWLVVVGIAAIGIGAFIFFRKK